MKLSKIPIKFSVANKSGDEVKNKINQLLFFKKKIKNLKKEYPEYKVLAEQIKNLREKIKEESTVDYIITIGKHKNAQLIQYNDKPYTKTDIKETIEYYIDSLRESRKRKRECVKEAKNIFGFKYKTTGGVFTENKSILSLMDSVNQYDRLNTQKKPHPTIKAKYLGFELELFHNMKDDQFRAELVKQRLAGYVHLHRDGSIRTDMPDQTATEVTVMCQQQDVEKVMERLCSVLRKANAGVNNTCGYHLHVDCRNRDPEVVYNNLVKCLPLLNSMVPPIRVKGAEAASYCKQNSTSDLKAYYPDKKTFSGSDRDRYQAINPAAFGKYSTIEVRLHSGTTNFNKIVMWAKICSTIADASPIKDYIKTVDQFGEIMKDKDVLNYITKRQKLFALTKDSIDTKVDHVMEFIEEIA